MICQAPEVTEEDKLRDEAARDEIMKKTGIKVFFFCKKKQMIKSCDKYFLAVKQLNFILGQPPPKYASTYREDGLECKLNKTIECYQSNQCNCKLPWKSATECRPFVYQPPMLTRVPKKCSNQFFGL
jgi:hypothetical protein